MVNDEVTKMLKNELSAFAYDKKVLKNYLFVIVYLKDYKKFPVRVNVFYKNSFSVSFLSLEDKLSDILTKTLELDPKEVKEIIKSVNCVDLPEMCLKE